MLTQLTELEHIKSNYVNIQKSVKVENPEDLIKFKVWKDYIARVVTEFCGKGDDSVKGLVMRIGRASQGDIAEMRWEEIVKIFRVERYIDRLDVVKLGEARWDEVRWCKLMWDKVRWSEMRWGEVRWGDVSWS